MPIENRNLEPGTRLTARYRKQPYYCQVIKGENGRLRYQLEDGREYKSPSAAGTAITGKACNGWTFWSVEKSEDIPSSETPEEEDGQEQETDTEATTAANRIFRTPNQKGVQEGQTRWYCQDCGESFLSPADETPETCPKGHSAS